MFRGPKLLKTHRRLIASAMLVEKEVTMQTNALIHALALFKQLHTPVPTRGANSVPITTKQNYARGRVNHVAIEEAQEVPDVVLGMFFVNTTSAVVLFHSGVSHSFISAAYVEKHNLPIALLKCQMIVSSSGGDMSGRQP
jgi:hypothetical protein